MGLDRQRFGEKGQEALQLQAVGLGKGVAFVPQQCLTLGLEADELLAVGLAPAVVTQGSAPVFKGRD